MYGSSCRTRKLLLMALLASGFVLRSSTAVESAEGDKPRSRTFVFTYAATVTGLPAGKVARIWVPVPPVTGEQDVEVVSKKLPGKALFGRDPTYKNLILYVEAKANEDGKVPL